MANFYVRSTDGSDADNGSTWALAKATLAGALNVAAAGDTIFVSDNHAETQASAMILSSQGTAPSPVRILCVDDSAEPPTALATTATVTTTGAFSMAFHGFAYCYGIKFSAASGAVNTDMTWVSTLPWWWRLENCALKVGGTGSVSNFIFGAFGGSIDESLLELINTTLEFSGTGQSIENKARFKWSNTPSAVLGTVPTTLFVPTLGGQGAPAEIIGVDLSALGSGKNLVNVSASTSLNFLFIDCKLGDGVSVTTGAVISQGGIEVRLINCDSGDTNYRYYKQVYQGTITQETTIVKTGGASDGTTPVSRKMVTTANSKLFSPLESDWIERWNEETGSSKTLTINVITDNVTLTDAEAWVEVEYLGTSGFPLGNFASDRVADVLATAANQTTDGVSSWTTTGLSTPVKQNLAVSFTPQEKGLIRARVCLAKASTTMYFDPKPTVS